MGQSQSQSLASETATSYPDVNRGPLLLRTVWVLTSISIVVVAARFWSKLREVRRLYWDDVLMLLSLLCGLSFDIQVTRAVSSGLGRHVEYLTADNLALTLQRGIYSFGGAYLSPALGRIGFCVTLLYLTKTDPRVKRWPLYIFIILQVAVNVCGVVVFYTQCGNRLDIEWNLAEAALRATKCSNPAIQTDYGYFMGSINTVTDAFLTALPAILIEHTRLSLKTKIGLAFLLCLSVLAMIASIVKTYEAKALSEVTDYTYALCSYVIWIAIEFNVVIIVSSIPILRPLFRRRQPAPAAPRSKRWDSSTVGSTFSTKSMRSNLARVGSEENIMEQQADTYSLDTRAGITVVHEVQVTYESSNTPYVHAALVGLLQGEIANPRLARR